MYLKKIKNGPKQQTPKKKEEEEEEEEDILLVMKVKNCWDKSVGALFLGPSKVVASSSMSMSSEVLEIKALSVATRSLRSQNPLQEKLHMHLDESLQILQHSFCPRVWCKHQRL